MSISKGKEQPVEPMGRFAAGIAGERAPISLLCATPVPIHGSGDFRQREVRVRVGRIELQRPKRRRAAGLERSSWFADVVVGGGDVRSRKSRVSRRETGVKGQRDLVIPARLRQAITAGLVPMVPSLQVRRMRFDVSRTDLGRSGRLGNQFQRQRMRNLSRDLGLHEETVTQVAFVRVGRKLHLALGLDQAGRDAHAIRVTPHGALEQVVRRQRLTDVAGGSRVPLHEH